MTTSFLQTSAYDLLDRFSPQVLGAWDGESEEPLRAGGLKLWEEGAFAMYYAPFGHVIEGAKIVMVGITPGMTQVRKAWKGVAEGLKLGMTTRDALAHAKKDASFGGMQKTIARYFDELGIARGLGIASSEQLFRNGMAHTASSLRYPIFKNGKNYTGYGPGPLDRTMFRQCIETMLAGELKRVPDALIVPFGGAVQSAVDHLVRRGDVDERRVLRGFPHPSPANGHKAKIFQQNQSLMAKAVERWFAAH